MPKILEKEIEDYVLKNHQDIDGLDGDYILRQFNLKGYGIIDLLIIKIDEEGSPIFKIVELKQNKINWQAINQICRYISGINYNLQEQGLSKVFDYSIEAYLIGDELAIDICYITDLLYDSSANINVITYKLDLHSGITFNYDNSGWYPTGRKKVSFDKYIKKAKAKHKKYEQIKNDKN